MSRPREMCLTLPAKDRGTEGNRIQAAPLQSHQVCRDFYRNSFISCCQGHRLMSQSQLGSHQRHAPSPALGLRAAWIPLGEPMKCQREGHCRSSGPHATELHLCESQSLSPGQGHRHEGPSRPTADHTASRECEMSNCYRFAARGAVLLGGFDRLTHAACSEHHLAQSKCSLRGHGSVGGGEDGPRHAAKAAKSQHRGQSLGALGGADGR